ncbi:MAG: PEP/pyruvate-binding domain-containing protein, partial [Candidatus Zixiibacteriota bacterium]
MAKITKSKNAGSKKSNPEKKSSREKSSRGKTASKFTLEHPAYYFFGGGKADGDGTMRDLLGGKGAGLAEMTRAGIPVPAGFTITTEVCKVYYQNNLEIPEEIDRDFPKYMAKIEEVMGAKFGDPTNPLLVSVRSGAKFS